MKSGDLAHVRFSTSFLLSAPFDRSKFTPEDINGRFCLVLKECEQIEVESRKENCFLVFILGAQQIILRKYLTYLPGI